MRIFCMAAISIRQRNGWVNYDTMGLCNENKTTKQDESIKNASLVQLHCKFFLTKTNNAHSTFLLTDNSNVYQKYIGDIILV